MTEEQIRQARISQQRILSYGIVQSIIDGVVFFGSNKVVLSLAKSGTKVNLTDALIFTVGDALLRQTPWIGPSFGGNALMTRPQWGMNAAISAAYIVVNTLVQGFMGKEIGASIEKSLIKGAIGFGGNAGVDFFMRSAYN